MSFALKITASFASVSFLFRGAICTAIGLAMVFTAGTVQAQQDGLADDDYRLATGYYKRTQWPQSAKAFQEFTLQYPDHAKAGLAEFFYGESRMQMGEYTDAFLAFKNVVENRPNHRMIQRATFRMGEAAYQLDKKRIALTALENFVHRFPNHELVEFAMPMLGELRLKFYEARMAQRVFETALRMFPESEFSTRNRYGLAKSFRMQGQLEQAVRLFRHVSETEYSTHGPLAKLQMGIIAFEEGMVDKARDFLADARTQIVQADHPEDALEAAYWMARVELESKNFDDAHEIYSQVKTLPAEENLGCGICYDASIAAMNVGQQQVALEWLGKLRRTWPNNGLADKAMALEIDLVRESGQHVVVMDYCKQFNERFPQSPLRVRVAEVAGRTLYNQKKYGKSVRAFRDLLAEQSVAIGDRASTPEQRSLRMSWYYLKSLAHLGLEQYDEAIADLELAEANLPESQDEPKLMLALASAWYGKKMYPDAATAFELYIDSEPESADAVKPRLIVCYANVGQFEKAEKFAIELMESQPKVGVDAVQFLADESFSKKRFDVSTRCHMLLADPNNDPSHVRQGLAGLSYMLMEDLGESSDEIFYRLVDEYPDSDFSSKAAISRARFLEEQGRIEAANGLYDLVITRFPQKELSQMARLRLAYGYQKAGDLKSLHRAKQLIEQFVEINSSRDFPVDANSAKLIDEAIYQLAWVNLDLENNDEAEQCFMAIATDYPDSKFWPDAACRCAQTLIEKSDTASASELLERILHQDLPAEIGVQALYLRSKIAAQSGDWESVVEPMSELAGRVEDDKVKATANYWHAEALYRTGDFETAGTIFDSIQPQAEFLGDKLEPWLLLRLAQCHGKSQRWTNAAMLARDCLDRFPNFANDYEFVYVLGRALEYDGVFDEARGMYEQVIKSENGASTETAAIAQWRIGETYFHQKEYKKAIKAYYKTDSLYDFDQWKSASLLQAGKCQERLEHWSHAAKLYTQLLDQHPASEFASEAKERLGRVTRIANSESNEKTTR